MRSLLLIILSIGVLFENLTFGLYLSIIRPYMESLNSPYILIFMVDTIWAIVGLSSIFWGYLSDKVGKRKMIPFGTLGFIPLILMSRCEDPVLILSYNGLYALFYTISQPSILALISYSERVGEAFAYYTISSSIGWGLGSLLMGYIHDVLGLNVEGVFLSSSISWIAGFTFLILCSRIYNAPEGGEGELKFQIPPSIRGLFVAELLAYTGLNWYFPLITLKLHEILGGNKLLYGLIWGTLPALTSLIVSPYAGKAAERIGGLKLVRNALLGYVIILPLLAVTSGYLTLIIWLTPIWPIHYVGINVAISQMTRTSERGEAMGAINTCYNLGMLLAIIGGFVADIIGRDSSMLIATLPVLLGLTIIQLFLVRR